MSVSCDCDVVWIHPSLLSICACWSVGVERKHEKRQASVSLKYVTTCVSEQTMLG